MEYQSADKGLVLPSAPSYLVRNIFIIELVQRQKPGAGGKRLICLVLQLKVSSHFFFVILQFCTVSCFASLVGRKINWTSCPNISCWDTILVLYTLIQEKHDCKSYHSSQSSVALRWKALIPPTKKIVVCQNLGTLCPYENQSKH